MFSLYCNISFEKLLRLQLLNYVSPSNCKLPVKCYFTFMVVLSPLKCSLHLICEPQNTQSTPLNVNQPVYVVFCDIIHSPLICKLTLNVNVETQ